MSFLPLQCLAKLNNLHHWRAEQKLGAFLDNLAIPSGLIEGIVQSDVDEDYQVPSFPDHPSVAATRDSAAVILHAACGLHRCMLAACLSLHAPSCCSMTRMNCDEVAACSSTYWLAHGGACLC